MFSHRNSTSSDRTRRGWEETVVADSASLAFELLFFLSEEDDDAVDGSRVVSGEVREGERSGVVEALASFDCNAFGDRLPVPSLTYNVVSSLSVD